MQVIVPFSNPMITSENLIMFLFVGSFIFMDVLTGIAQAVANRTLDSTVMRQGLWHKLAYVFAILLAGLCQYGTPYLDLGMSVELLLPVCTFISLTEIVSILENLAQLNPDIANSKLLELFKQNANKSEENMDEEKD